MRTLSWHDLETALEQIAAPCAGASTCGIHGVPRGGLVLALPLLSTPQVGCLVVESSTWIVFPWHNPTLAAADEQQYRASRP